MDEGVNTRTCTHKISECFPSLLKISEGLDNNFATAQLQNTSSVSEEKGLCALASVCQKVKAVH